MPWLTRAVGPAAVAARPQPGAPAAWRAADACGAEPKAWFLLGAGIGNNDLNECSCEVQLTGLALGSLCSTGLIIKLSQEHGICCRGIPGSCGVKEEGVNLYMQKHLFVNEGYVTQNLITCHWTFPKWIYQWLVYWTNWVYRVHSVYGCPWNLSGRHINVFSHT